jgi:hypothetical protein
MTANTDMHLLVTGTLKMGRVVDQKTSQYLVWPPFASWTTHLLRIRVDQAVDCGMWNVVPLLFNDSVNSLDIGGNWNTLLYTSIQSIPNMLNGWYVWWVCRPWKNWDIFSFQELCTDPCNMELCIIMLKYEVMAVDERSHHSISFCSV